jgi:putative nucleotidyltransferase with HDIG domain
VGAALGAVTAAEDSGSPFAACFLDWGEDGFGVQALNDLLRVSPNLFLVLEGDAQDLPSPSELGPWVRPERCVTLARPVHPSVRESLADHLGARWHREATDRKRISVLEAESRSHQAHRQRYEDRLHVLYGIVEKLHETGSLDDGLGVALGEMSRFLGARTGSLLLLDDTDRLRVLEAVGPNRSRILGIDIPLEESRISRYALEERRPILVEDMQDNDRFRESEDGIRFRARSILSVPLFNNRAPLGVLNFGADARKASFTEQDRELVITLGRQVAVALERGRLLKGLRAAVGESIRALAGAIEAKDPYTRGHSDRVTHYSRLIAEAMGLSGHELDVIVRAAILHDVGKIGVPELVLNKPGRLTDEEFLLIRKHPVVGVEIVREIQAMEETLDIIRAHHERVDGKGYPSGIRGDDIPLGARIMAVVDTYDAMTSDRPYRQGLPAEVAFEEIERCSSTQFDPEVAQVFLKGASEWPDLVSPLPEAAEA